MTQEITPTPPPGIPLPYVEPSSPEAQAHRWIRRMDWEALKRCVGRIKEPDLTTASWALALLGSAISSLVGFVTLIATSNGSFGTHVALVLLGLVCVFSLASAEFCRRIEKGNRANREDFLTALKEEMAAMERYMTVPPESA